MTFDPTHHEVFKSTVLFNSIIFFMAMRVLIYSLFPFYSSNLKRIKSNSLRETVKRKKNHYELEICGFGFQTKKSARFKKVKFTANSQIAFCFLSL